jgi:hypothetical protein
MAAVLETRGRRLFGVDRVTACWLTVTNQAGQWCPTKKNIRNVFRPHCARRPGPGCACDLSRSARRRSAGADEYYLTTVSSTELKQLYQHILALKQVVILDTCAAGAE